ncbi:Transcription initiation factor IIA subunit 2 [Capsicum annuum]|nr:Transcription initiation factor IIA subunit 2 [Capsicum annuum]
MKHTSSKFFYIHELQKNGDINMQQIRSSDNVADLFTKSSPVATFKKMVHKIGMQRRSTIGMCLTETLDEMVSNGILSPEHAIQVLVQFDKHKAGNGPEPVPLDWFDWNRNRYGTALPNLLPEPVLPEPEYRTFLLPTHRSVGYRCGTGSDRNDTGAIPEFPELSSRRRTGTGTGIFGWFAPVPYSGPLVTGIPVPERHRKRSKWTGPLPALEQQLKSERAIFIIYAVAMQSMTEALETQVKSKVTIKGHLHTYRFCDNVWTFILQDAVFKSEECQETVNRVKIVACDSKLLTQ